MRQNRTVHWWEVFCFSKASICAEWLLLTISRKFRDSCNKDWGLILKIFWYWLSALKNKQTKKNPNYEYMSVAVLWIFLKLLRKKKRYLLCQPTLSLAESLGTALQHGWGTRLKDRSHCKEGFPHSFCSDQQHTLSQHSHNLCMVSVLTLSLTTHRKHSDRSSHSP